MAGKTPTPKTDEGFKVWMNEVNARVAAKLGGLTTDDLPDCSYRDWYDDGYSAAKAAAAAIRSAKEDGGY